MKNFNKILNIFVCILSLSLNSYAQEEDKEFVIDSTIFKKGSNWISISAGTGYNYGLKTQETNADVSLQLQIKKVCLQTGYHISSDEFFLNRSLQKLNDFHLGVGVRSENTLTNFAVFGGPSYSFGSSYDGYNSDSIKTYKGFGTLGFYSDVQFTYKLFYDVGLGISLYSSLSKNYQVIGVQVHLYFSGAYKGRI